MTQAALRLLLQAAAAPAAELAGGGGVGGGGVGGGGTLVHLYSTAQSSDVGTGEPEQTIPSTAAVVGAVVGGLSTLTVCLAVALVFAVARIYGWRLFRPGGAKGGKRRSDVESVLEMEREAANGPIPSIVTTRLVESPTPTSRGSSRAADAGHTDRTDNSLMSPSGSSQIADFRSDMSWKDCLIDPEQIQILRRRDGRPWVLGGGAFGQVYKALYDGVQVVAAKVLTGLSDERMFNAFVREAAILRDMRDKNIVQFVGVCMGRSEEGQPDEAMMIQEFMEAGDLFKALRWRDHQGRRVYGYYARGRKAAIDISRGLHYLHAHKTVHLDMKSSNVLLTRDGTCKIADVGLARTLLTKNFLTQAGTMGTFAWSAPEVLTGQPVGTSADIYSLGIVLWELVTGEIPNRGTMRDPRVPEECPQSVLDLINRCCDLDPAKRPTAKQVVLALEGGSATPSSPETRAAPLRSASLAPWRDRLPQQVSKYMPNSGDSHTLTQPDGSMPLPFGSAPAPAGPSSGGGQQPLAQQASDTAGDEHPAAAAGAAAAAEAAAAAAGVAAAAAGPAGGSDEEGLGEDGSGGLFGYGTLDMEEAAQRAEEQGQQPAPPQRTLRMDELPPLSSSEQLFR